MVQLTRDLEYFLKITQMSFHIAWIVSLEMCAFNGYGFSVYSVQRVGSYKIKGKIIFSSGLYQLDLFFCFHCKFLKAEKEVSLCCECEPSCSTLSILTVMISQGHADDLTKNINVALLLSSENFNIWSLLSQEMMQTEHIIICKRVWRNVWSQRMSHIILGVYIRDTESGLGYLCLNPN